MKKASTILVLISMILLLGAGCDNKEKEIKKENVVVSAPTGENVIEAYGTARVIEINNISLEVADKIKSIEVKAGQKVKKGEKLIQAGSTSIASPFESGLVYEINCREGDYGAPGVSLVSIANLDSMVIEVNVDQQSIRNIALGSAAKITPETDKTIVYDGKVTFISSKAVNRNGETTIPIQISLDKKTPDIVLDSDVRAEITTTNNAKKVY